MRLVSKEVITKKAKQAWLFFLDLIFPIECLACGQAGEWLCQPCFGRIKIKTEQYCLKCKKENLFGRFCADCRAAYALDGVWLATDYENPAVARLVKSFKYNLVKELDRILARILILFLGDLLNKNELVGRARTAKNYYKFSPRNLPEILSNFREILVIPVPLQQKRLRWRGFNQAELIAEKLAGQFGLALDSRSLVRIKHKTPQAKLNEAERQANVKNCFTLSAEARDFKDKMILLIDDVVTTGATLNECARVLKAAGAREVWGLAVAKG